MKTVVRKAKQNFFGFNALVVVDIVQDQAPEEVAKSIIKNNPDKEIKKEVRPNGEVELLINDEVVYDLAFQ
jgi:hypothetical protein